MFPSSYVQIVDNNDDKVVENNDVPPLVHEQQQQQQQHQQQHPSETVCSDQATCPFATRRPSSSLERHHRVGSFSLKTAGSQSTLNTVCSSHKSQPNAFYNRLYNSDPNTNTIGTHSSHITDDTEYLSNYAHIKHSHRHPHYHLRRQSQPDEPRLMSRNSSVKSFTSQCFINPEYFYEIRPSRSCDSKASLISHKPSQNQIMLLNSELHLLENLRDHAHSYPKINYIDKHYLLDGNGALTPGDYDDNDDVPMREMEQTTSSTSSECSDASEFHENKTSTLDRKKMTAAAAAAASAVSQTGFSTMGYSDRPPPMYSETDSYSTVNDEITQLVSKHLSNSIKQLVAQRFTDINSYTLPLRRRHSCDSSELSDIEIPDLFNSPSRIKWNFLTGLPDRSRSQSQIYSSDYKTDEDDEDDDDENENDFQTKIQEILAKQRHSHGHIRGHGYRETTIVPLWRTNSYGSREQDDYNSIIQQQQPHQHQQHAGSEECCEAHYRYHHQHDIDDAGSSSGITTDNNNKKFSGDGNHVVRTKEEDSAVYEFELCTKENCEYLSKSQLVISPSVETTTAATTAAVAEQKNLLNNEIPNGLVSNSNHGSTNNVKNINLKHNKFKLKKTKKSKKSSSAVGQQNGKEKENRDENLMMWSKINLNHLMKKDSCNINSVNLKPHSSSSSTESINHIGNHHNLNKRRAKSSGADKLFNASISQDTQSTTQPQPQENQQQQQRQHRHRHRSLNVASLILASFNSTQARIRNDGGIYFSNPDLSSIPADLRSMNFLNNNSSCQFINNDLRNNDNVNNRNSSRFDSRFNNLNSATNYLLDSINSNNIDNSNNSEIMQQQDLRRRLRYINLHGMLRRARKRAQKYLTSISFASRK